MTSFIKQLIQCLDIVPFHSFFPIIQPRLKYQIRNLRYKIPTSIIFVFELFKRQKMGLLHWIVPKGHNGKQQVVFLPLFNDLSLYIGKLLMRNRHPHILIGIHPINNLLFPTVNSSRKKLSTMSVKSRLVLWVKMLQPLQDLFTQPIDRQLLLFWTLMMSWTLKPSNPLRKRLQLRVEHLLRPSGTRLLMSRYRPTSFLLMGSHFKLLYTINKSIKLLICSNINISPNNHYYSLYLAFILTKSPLRNQKINPPKPYDSNKNSNQKKPSNFKKITEKK